MVVGPIVHAMPISSGDEKWVWLCTGKGYIYVNFNADSTDDLKKELTEQPKKPSVASCCLYDAAPDIELVVFSITGNQTQPTKSHIYRISYNNSFTHYTSRAPPATFS